MGYKKARLATRIVSASPRERYRDVHVFLGGTGAVGGTTLLKMLALYEEMMSVHKAAADEVPVLVATGRSSLDIRAFTSRLFRLIEARYGKAAAPSHVGAGYLTHSGVYIALKLFDLSALPGFAAVIASVDSAGRARSLDELDSDSRRAEAATRYLRSIGVNRPTDRLEVAEALSSRARQARPMSEFLQQYRANFLLDHGPDFRYRSVVNGIPLPSFLSYPRDIDAIARYVPALSPESLVSIKESLIQAVRDDLAHIKAQLADSVLIAHTTSVGGMYDESVDSGGRSRRTIRLGFAHSARDEALITKQHFAEALTEEYGRAGVKVLVTAAAIGIDEVRVRKTVPLHPAVKQLLQKAHGEGHDIYPESISAPVVPVLQPLTIPLSCPAGKRVHFKRRRTVDDLRPSYTLRSGENGFFSVSNAEALYRVMRVASTGELGLMLATVGLFGDDEQSPWFDRSNICYYTETDNSRQVFDFLAQPILRQAEISGLEPLALQDLGSAKHQGELHTLGLLILLHRIRTLDVDAIPQYVDVQHFDSRDFFLRHSMPLTLDALDNWDLERTARDLVTLVAANEAADLESLAPFRPNSHDILFPEKVEAREKLLDLVKRAVWTIPSLGTPIIYEHGGNAFIRCGPFIAPFGCLLENEDSLLTWLHNKYRETKFSCSFDEYRDFHLCNSGFIDIRKHAIVTAASSDRGDLRGAVHYAVDERELRTALRGLKPYSVFTTCGLLAVLYRLKALYSSLKEADVRLGTLQESQWQMSRDASGRLLLIPGVVEAVRMISEGLEKTTGTERLGGFWGYERPTIADRRNEILIGSRNGRS